MNMNSLIVQIAIVIIVGSVIAAIWRIQSNKKFRQQADVISKDAMTQSMEQKISSVFRQVAFWLTMLSIH